jgi:hypothetical protein
MTGRRSAMALFAVSGWLLGTAGAAEATDAQYHVLKCHVNSRPASEVEAGTTGPYYTADSCAGPDQRLEVNVNGFGLPGQAGYVRFGAPEGTSIVGVSLDANLRRDNHHFAQLAVVDYQGASHVLAQGDDTGSGFQSYSFLGLNDLRFVVQLFCSDPGGCPNSSQAHAYARNIDLVLADRVDPEVTDVSGDLVDPGWIRGVHTLRAVGGDVGSGLSTLMLRVNSTVLTRMPGVCDGVVVRPYASVLVPCGDPAATPLFNSPLDTQRAPFVDGVNQVELCAEDFAGNQPPCDSLEVSVDNAPPNLAFTVEQDPADPELVRAPAVDGASGIDPDSVQISYRSVGAPDWMPLSTHLVQDALVARVDSSASPAGIYEFEASATDRAGNFTQTTRRTDGEPMVLGFPLREWVQLVSGPGPASETKTIGYGQDSHASGRILDQSGRPLAGQDVTVSEYFGIGALIDRRIRTVVTDRKGHWTSSLPAGPSRAVAVSFAGTPRFQPAATAGGELRVRSRSSFEISRDRVSEGGAVAFRGKVGHFGAHIPAGGKLVELQVREGPGKWNTVREAFHTSTSGRFHLRYRFGDFYERNATFAFRLKVAREQGWPYQAPGHSTTKTVTVVATDRQQ